MGKDVHFIASDGLVAERNDLMNWIRQSWANYSAGEFNIRIKEFQLLQETEENALVAYEEWQNIRGKTIILVSTVIFNKTKNNYHNLEWQHIHVSEKKQ